MPQGLLEKTSRVQLLSDPSLIWGRSFWFLRGFPGGSDIKESAMWETQVQSLGQEDPLGEGNGYPFQYSCLENPMEGGTW